ncbi:Phosphate transport system permease protein PstA [Dissulfuribacter thermophilus]|uniref:Phosphate transport system permease protein PstA n=1 Tax=Dissulfuribacter thermophilus TaxID=1156395 RepID=A0A1B9F529_9BACT|nr:phosphate ABC transporter permease PstA [Dissulfuribacter thermophilus]OCC14925.1 Phosphate transport system permease protein PstA [Dissulfuribacter thermophilus]
MTLRSRSLRKFVNLVALICASVSALIGIFFLVWILWEITGKGISSVNWEFFSELPTPPGEPGGGLANAIVGSIIITLLAMVLGVPIGILAGTYLSEFGHGRFADLIRFITNTFVSAPSIVVGVFVYSIMVVPMKSFSGLAGGVSLGIIMLPVITRTTEEILRLVPVGLREAALALGTPYWKMVVSIVYRAAKTGMITGVILAVARVSGETAPLLFTALNSPYWPSGLTEPMANLTVTIFNYAMSPYEDWQAKAWGGAFLITAAILAINILSRLFAQRGSKK